LADSYFWAIDRGRFRKAVEELAVKDFSENRKFIDSIQFFDVMSDSQKDMIAGVIVT
jgi:cGMP-dependent protein kinase